MRAAEAATPRGVFALCRRETNRAQDRRPTRRITYVVNSRISESADVIAWNRARFRKIVELACAIAAGLAITVMFVVFSSILTR